ncbi:MAG: hypothetical protein NZ561_00455 [Phycisphaerae bacterium]|nr:hypothetical protein [Phycisphaerae bacterium]MDW8261306.1 hypothetical protein [Phycisphaerales bacterium]
MPARKAFLLRIDPAILEAIQRWANDDLRSLNAQIEFLLRRALRDARRDRALPAESSGSTGPPPAADLPPDPPTAAPESLPPPQEGLPPQ